MEEFRVSKETGDLLYSFNKTLFDQQVMSKDFLHQTVRVEKYLMQYIYSKGDIKFAAELTKIGANFDVSSHLMPAMLRYNKITLMHHITDIKKNIDHSKYHIAHAILDSWYSNHYVRQIDSVKCFYPPLILANATRTNNPEYKEKIYDMYKKLYESECAVIKDVLTIAAITILRNPSSLILAPVTPDHSAIKYARCIDLADQSTSICLIPFQNFSDYEIGRFVHELTHFSDKGLYKNGNNPYPAFPFTAKQEYEFASKQMISNITALAEIDFIGDIHAPDVSVLDLKNILLSHRDLILYTIPDRIDDPIRVDLLFNVFYGNETVVGQNSKELYLYAMYKAQLATKNISQFAEIALERFGDWVTYQDNQLNIESHARFVELLYRGNKLGVETDVLNSMIIVHGHTVHQEAEALKIFLNLTDCNYNLGESMECFAISIIGECIQI
jgi:hypothetical protein